MFLNNSRCTYASSISKSLIATEELHLREIAVDPKEKITEIKKKLINHEYSDTTTNVQDKKFFSPKLITNSK